ncbi:uncharacterized protein [Amphiura filiformis]|uniref:uncharacterized protein n=1 Tax=Amphiura filiformis TaxID=82378 RepID=UPI003B21D97B
MMEWWISKGIFASLTFMFFIGSTCACASSGYFQDFQFNDGELGNPYLRIQEGAIVDIVCKSHRAIGGPLSAIEVKWDLQVNPFGYNLGVDHEVFPAERNYEKYDSEYVEGPNFNNPFAAKVMSTLRYTARKEDHYKLLFCREEDERGARYPFVDNHMRLIIRPAPTPLSFKSTILHKFGGGFVGRIDIPISDYYTSWKIILTFPRKVFDLKGGHFQVANEPCLHKPDCGDDYQKKWVIYQTFANRVQNPGDHLRLTFVARVWKKITQGLIADIDFYGYNQVFIADTIALSSSSDIHVM